MFMMFLAATKNLFKKDQSISFSFVVGTGRSDIPMLFSDAKLPLDNYECGNPD